MSKKKKNKNKFRRLRETTGLVKFVEADLSKIEPRIHAWSDTVMETMGIEAYYLHPRDYERCPVLSLLEHCVVCGRPLETVIFRKCDYVEDIMYIFKHKRSAVITSASAYRPEKAMCYLLRVNLLKMSPDDYAKPREEDVDPGAGSITASIHLNKDIKITLPDPATSPGQRIYIGNLGAGVKITADVNDYQVVTTKSKNIEFVSAVNEEGDSEWVTEFQSTENSTPENT